MTRLFCLSLSLSFSLFSFFEPTRHQMNITVSFTDTPNPQSNNKIAGRFVRVVNQIICWWGETPDSWGFPVVDRSSAVIVCACVCVMSGATKRTNGKVCHWFSHTSNAIKARKIILNYIGASSWVHLAIKFRFADTNFFSLYRRHWGLVLLQGLLHTIRFNQIRLLCMRIGVY